LNNSTEVIGNKLAEILTEYLRNNWVKSPTSKLNITPTTNMVTELQLDSFQVMEFMLEVEDHLILPWILKVSQIFNPSMILRPLLLLHIRSNR